jgi:hypothetical protein
MASLGVSLFTQLQSISAITALVANRIYPQYQKLADKTYPAITYKVGQLSTINVYDPSMANALVSCQVTFDCIGQSYADSGAVASAVQKAFDGFSGTWGGTTIQGCFLEEDGINDYVETDEVTEEILTYIKEIAFKVWYVNS